MKTENNSTHTGCDLEHFQRLFLEHFQLGGLVFSEPLPAGLAALEAWVSSRKERGAISTDKPERFHLLDDHPHLRTLAKQHRDLFSSRQAPSSRCCWAHGAQTALNLREAFAYNEDKDLWGDWELPPTARTIKDIQERVGRCGYEKMMERAAEGRSCCCTTEEVWEGKRFVRTRGLRKCGCSQEEIQRLLEVKTREQVDCVYFEKNANDLMIAYFQKNANDLKRKRVYFEKNEKQDLIARIKDELTTRRRPVVVGVHRHILVILGYDGARWIVQDSNGSESCVGLHQEILSLQKNGTAKVRETSQVAEELNDSEAYWPMNDGTIRLAFLPQRPEQKTTLRGFRA